MAESPEEKADPELQDEAPRAAPENQPLGDSSTFARCASCANAKDVDSNAGTLTCTKHNMCINAEADEIPDDCVEFTPVEKE